MIKISANGVIWSVNHNGLTDLNAEKGIIKSEPIKVLYSESNPRVASEILSLTQ